MRRRRTDLRSPALTLCRLFLGDWSDTVALTSAEADRPILESDEPQAAGQSHAFYTVEYYQRFFDIDTPQVRFGLTVRPHAC